MSGRARGLRVPTERKVTVAEAEAAVTAHHAAWRRVRELRDQLARAEEHEAATRAHAFKMVEASR